MTTTGARTPPQRARGRVPLRPAGRLRAEVRQHLRCVSRNRPIRAPRHRIPGPHEAGRGRQRRRRGGSIPLHGRPALGDCLRHRGSMRRAIIAVSVSIPIAVSVSVSIRGFEASEGYGRRERESRVTHHVGGVQRPRATAIDHPCGRGQRLLAGIFHEGGQVHAADRTAGEETTQPNRSPVRRQLTQRVLELRDPVPPGHVDRDRDVRPVSERRTDQAREHVARPTSTKTRAPPGTSRRSLPRSARAGRGARPGTAATSWARSSTERPSFAKRL